MPKVKAFRDWLFEQAKEMSAPKLDSTPRRRRRSAKKR
jgi:hypothetical protein